MVSSRAWFALAVVGVLGLFYFGSGLRDQPQFTAGNVYAQEAPGRIQWERVLSNANPISYRTKVPGGWLVLISPPSSITSESGITFLPDPQHKWDGTSLK